MPRFVAIAAASATLAFAGTAHAGIYTDDLSKCLVKSTTDTDRTELVVWIFDAIAQHPAVSKFSSITAVQREASDKKTAQLLTRLLLEDCRGQTVDAIKYEGSSAIQESFSVLGRVAVSGMMSDPAVSNGIGGMAKYLDEEKFKAMLAAAGQPQAPKK